MIYSSLTTCLKQNIFPLKFLIFLFSSRPGTRYFVNVLSQSVDPSRAVPHNHSYSPSEDISDPADQNFCDWINPRPCNWSYVTSYWAAFQHVGYVDVNGSSCANFWQGYSYGGPSGSAWQVNRSVELAFYSNGSLARLNHTEYRSWGITHSIDIASNHVYFN